MSRRGEAVVLRVVDNGCGAPEPDAVAGAGIRGRRERALLDGQLTLETGANGGTEVRLAVGPGASRSSERRAR